jgi:DNA anti-recombination protein RmuC
MLKTRTRLVSFRLSEEEYQRLKYVCSQKGARSISDGARALLCQIRGFSDELSAEGSAGIKSGHLIDSLERLNTGINRLTDLVEKLKDYPPSGSNGSTNYSRLLDEVSETNLK